ncbi:MAG: transporter [Verrucomicrobiota bacterium]
MKILPSLLAVTLAFVVFAEAGEPSVFAKEPVHSPFVGGFEDARRPISNPTLFDLAIPQTQLHPIFAYHRLPSSFKTTLGDVPVGGHVEAYAVQLEIALTERLSLNAVKDGYFIFEPDATLSNTEGWGNIGAGLKYALILNHEKQLAVSTQLVYEVPSGSREVFQGEGDGTFIPSLNVLKLHNRWQFANQFGFEIPVDSGAESSTFYNSMNVSYKLTDRIFPMFEVNWFSVLDAGDGGQRFNEQVGGLVPAVATFEGHDLFNFGAANAEDNRHLVTFALGSRARITDRLDLGFAWEFPVTDSDASVIEDRFYFDFVLRF